MSHLKQILAAQIRKAIAEKDLDNHNVQIEAAEEVNTFMKDKFTDQELYNWMVSQISTIYFQSYQMAYDIAKRAEAAGCLAMPPTMMPPPIGYICMVADPDGNMVEFSWDQGVWSTLRDRWDAAKA